MKSHRLYRHIVVIPVLLLVAANVAAESPSVHIEYQARVDDTGGLRYIFAEGTMSGTVRGDATYTVPVQIHYPIEGGNGTAVLELTNSALLFFHLEARGDRVGDRRSDADDIDELEAMQVNFGWAGARDYLLRNGFTHMAIQYSKMVTDFMGETPPEGRTRRRLCYGRIELASDGYEIVRDAARWLAAPARGRVIRITAQLVDGSSKDHISV